MATRRITLSIPDDLARRVRAFASQHDTSVSAIVTEFLSELVGSEVRYEDVWAAEEAIMASGTGMQIGAIIWDRDDVHRR